MSSLNLAVRTGRNRKGSAQGTTPIAAANASRHEATDFNLFPGRGIGLWVGREMRCILDIVLGGFVNLHRINLLLGRAKSLIGADQAATTSTSTSQPLEVGMPVPSVSPPISLQVGGP